MIASLLLGLLGHLAALLAALLALLLLVPFYARARGSIHGGSAEGAVEAAWGPGLVALRLSSGDGLRVRLLGIPLPRLRLGQERSRSRRQRRERKAARRKERPGEKQQEWRQPRAGALLRHRAAFLRMALELARPLRLRLRIAGTVGTGDPADVALLAALARAAGELPGVALDVTWDWVDEVVELDGELSARIWIIHLLGAAAALWLRRENRAALRAVRG